MPVVIVFLEGSTRTVTAAEAITICTDPARAGQVLDVLTDDTELQSRLRQEMDKY